MLSQFSQPTHPIWTAVIIVLVGGFIIGTLVVTTSKWDSEILIAIAAIGGPLMIEYFRRKWSKDDQSKTLIELQARLKEREELLINSGIWDKPGGEG